MSRFQEIFARARAAKRCALIPYITAGDPSLEASLDVCLRLADSGADIIELGIPFSDPMADGPVIQRATERALRQGTTLRKVLDLAARIRERSAVGLLIFGYYNPILRFGPERFAAAAAQAGVDGVLVTDLIPEEAGEHRRQMRQAGLDTVFLAAPTSPEERLRAIADASTGFIYAVSRLGVTGARQSVPASAREIVDRLRQVTDKPVALGFGLSTAQQVAEVGQFADGAVVDTALVAAIAAAPEGEAGAAAAHFLTGLRQPA